MTGMTLLSVFISLLLERQGDPLTSLQIQTLQEHVAQHMNKEQSLSWVKSYVPLKGSQHYDTKRNKNFEGFECEKIEILRADICFGFPKKLKKWNLYSLENPDCKEDFY